MKRVCEQSVDRTAVRCQCSLYLFAPAPMGKRWVLRALRGQRRGLNIGKRASAGNIVAVTFDQLPGITPCGQNADMRADQPCVISCASVSENVRTPPMSLQLTTRSRAASDALTTTVSTSGRDQLVLLTSAQPQSPSLSRGFRGSLRRIVRSSSTPAWGRRGWRGPWSSCLPRRSRRRLARASRRT